MSGSTFWQDLRSRLTDGNWRYLDKLVLSVGSTLSLIYMHLAMIYQGGENPWSLLAPVLGVPAIGFFLVGWTYARPVPYLIGFILICVGGLVPIAILG